MEGRRHGAHARDEAAVVRPVSCPSLAAAGAAARERPMSSRRVDAAGCRRDAAGGSGEARCFPLLELPEALLARVVEALRARRAAWLALRAARCARRRP